MIRHTPLLLAATALLSTAATAQRLAMPDGRTLRMFDLRETQGGPIRGPRTFGSEASRHVADMLRPFVQPALRDGDDLRAIGDQWLAVLADQERIASVDRLLQAAKKHREDLVTIEVRLLEFGQEAFAAHLQDQLTAVQRGEARSYEAVIPSARAAAFAATAAAQAAQSLAAPRLSVLPLQRANVSIVNEVSYVKDFRVERRNDAGIADPIIDKTWEGHRSDVCATFLPDGRIGLRCEVRTQQLHRPIPEVQVEVLPGAPKVTLQLPRTSGVRLASVAELDAGSLMVLASQRGDGSFLVATVKASATGHR